MLKIREKSVCFNGFVEATRDDVRSYGKDPEILKAIFKKEGHELVDLISFTGMWVFALTSDGVLWLNDFSHGGGGRFQPDMHSDAWFNMFCNPMTVKNTPKIKTFLQSYGQFYFEYEEGDGRPLRVQMDELFDSMDVGSDWKTDKLAEELIKFHTVADYL